MIHAMLCSPAMRDGLTPRFEPIDKFLDDGLRWKRIRQWAGDGIAAKILPWIALNPSGSNKSGHGLSGRTMARLAYRWVLIAWLLTISYHFQGLNWSEIFGHFWSGERRTGPANTNCSPKNSG
jgi:hypothetical protein